MKIKRNNFSSTWNKTFVGFQTSDFGFIWNRMWSVVWLRGCCERVWRERGELQMKTTMKKSWKNVFKSLFVAGSWGWVDEMSKFKIATSSAPRTQTDHRSNPGSSNPDTSTVRDPSDNLTATRRRVGPGPLATRTPHEYTGVQIRRQLMRETDVNRETEREEKRCFKSSVTCRLCASLTWCYGTGLRTQPDHTTCAYRKVMTRTAPASMLHPSAVFDWFSISSITLANLPMLNGDP